MPFEVSMCDPQYSRLFGVLKCVAVAMTMLMGCSFEGADTASKIECLGTRDCAPGQVCACERCVEPSMAEGACGIVPSNSEGDALACGVDEDCDTGRYCDAERGECVEYDCEGDEDCAGSTRCEGFQCVPTEEETVCEPSQVVCEEGEEGLLVCMQ